MIDTTTVTIELSRQDVDALRKGSMGGLPIWTLPLLRKLRAALPQPAEVTVELAPEVAAEMARTSEYSEGWASGMEIGPYSAAALNALCDALKRRAAG